MERREPNANCVRPFYLIVGLLLQTAHTSSSAIATESVYWNVVDTRLDQAKMFPDTEEMVGSVADVDWVGVPTR